MSNTNAIFGVNTYSYTFGYTAADCIRHLASQGYPAFELMFYPGHLWPTEMSKEKIAEIRKVCEQTGTRLISCNMPNIDLNIAGASAEMRDYSLGLLSKFVELAGEIGAPAIVIGPGKANPLFPAPREILISHFREALDRLAPIAKKSGTRLLVENMPFGFIPDAKTLLAEVEAYGDPDVGIIYDVANAHFIGENACDGMRLLKNRLGLLHFSDTARSVYRHDTIGLGDVPFADYPSVMQEIGYSERPVLEVISTNADADTANSAARLAKLGYR
jgi:L-ribulose-5-phosphate 3-epimerase